MEQMGHLWILVWLQYTILLLYIKQKPSPKVQYKIMTDVERSYLAVTALQIQHHLGSTLSSKVLRTFGG